MKEAIAFDTHRFVKHLIDGGFTERQAEALADEQIAMLNTNLATRTDIQQIRADMDAMRLATKADMEVLRQETKTEIAQVQASVEALRLATKADIASVKADLLKWMIGALIAQGGLVVALIKLL